MTKLVAALTDFAASRPGAYQAMKELQPAFDGLRHADPQFIELAALKVAGGTGDPRFIPVLARVIHTRFATQAKRLSTPSPEWESLSSQQKSHFAVAEVTDLFELLDEQIEAAKALGELARGQSHAGECIAVLQAAAGHPDCHRALAGAIRPVLQQLGVA